MSNPTPAAANPMQQIMDLSTAVEAAKQDRNEKQATLKHHHKTVYMPMCILKKDAEELYDRKAAELKALLKKNASLVEALRGIK